MSLWSPWTLYQYSIAQAGGRAKMKAQGTLEKDIITLSKRTEEDPPIVLVE